MKSRTTSSQFAITVPANGSLRLTTTNSGKDVSQGWATLESTSRLQAVATYDFRVGNALYATAGMLGTTGTSRAIVPIELDGSSILTGIAVANPQNSSIGVRLRLY